MKKAIIIIFAVASSLTSCSPKYVYTVNYYKTIDWSSIEESTDYIFVNPKDTACWDWYKETEAFEMNSPGSDSITIRYWGSLKEFRKMSRTSSNKRVWF
tara:strand:- start:1184 stop:1480 length:297 start_codon:yes stop_codon:yes gene_type:complete